MLAKPPFFPAARPINAAKRGYSTDSTTMGFNGVLTDGAGGSAQTDLSNLVGPAASHEEESPEARRFGYGYIDTGSRQRAKSGGVRWLSARVRWRGET